ncbi:MAG: dTDP-glucose 4,6-dehydratase [Candidatus Omnitrophica bacterium]|nr:dTDP-glucose 4,6-dehydratase [Candidatus Omnitrophota bacterium]
MNFLITGGCGFIGSNFIRFILKKYKDIRIVNLDKLTYCGNPDNLKGLERDERYTFVKGDICDEKLVLRLVRKTEVIVNFAAESHVDRSIKYPNDFMMTNFCGVKTILDTAKASKIKKFIQIGTDEVYGSIKRGLSGEKDLLSPNSPYSASKAAADLLALSYFNTYSLPVVITRSSNNFGPFQYPEKLIPLFITNILNNEKVPLYGDGKNVRDWLFVEDNCRAIDLVIQKGKEGEIYNIGGGTQLANYDLTEKILKKMDKDKDSIEYVKDRPGHDRRYALDSSKIKKLGWKTGGNFDKRLEETIKWYAKNKNWWRPLKERAEIIEW